MHYLKRLMLGGAAGFTVTLATFFYWVRYFDVDDYAGFGIISVLFMLTGLGAILGVFLGFSTRPRKQRNPEREGIGLSRDASGP